MPRPLSAVMTRPADAAEAVAGARAKGVCVRCQRAPVIRTVAELSEYRKTARCGPCSE